MSEAFDWDLVGKMVDLRWGVAEEAAADQSTMRICRAEIARCQAATPRKLNFNPFSSWAYDYMKDGNERRNNKVEQGAALDGNSAALHHRQ